MSVKTYGGTGSDSGASVIISSSGNIYLTSKFSNTVDFGNGIPITCKGGQDAALQKIDSDLNTQCVYTFGGTALEDHPYQATISNTNYIYVTGNFMSTVDFGDGNPITSHGLADECVVKLSE